LEHAVLEKEVTARENFFFPPAALLGLRAHPPCPSLGRDGLEANEIKLGS
jgi:hypothetical protein